MTRPFGKKDITVNEFCVLLLVPGLALVGIAFINKWASLLSFAVYCTAVLLFRVDSPVLGWRREVKK